MQCKPQLVTEKLSELFFLTATVLNKNKITVSTTLRIFLIKDFFNNNGFYAKSVLEFLLIIVFYRSLFFTLFLQNSTFYTSSIEICLNYWKSIINHLVIPG